jgi:uncharacterized SAM-binding protein YcdF (DUF218 family)
MRKALIILAAVIGVLVVLVVAFIAFAGFYLSPQNALKKSDAIVAISGGETQQRVDEAVRLYKAGWAPSLIFSGAAAAGTVSNALAMERQAIAEGVPESVISIDELSTNTAQNAKDVGALIRRRGIHQIILVTSPYHQRRAYITFHRVLGSSVKIINHSSIDSVWRKSSWWKQQQTRQLTFSELEKILYIKFTGKTSI